MNITLSTPLGPLRLCACDGTLTKAEFIDEASLSTNQKISHLPSILEQSAEAIERYFSGQLDALDEVSCVSGGSPLQEAVWQVLRQIPPGETLTYSEVAERIARPQAARAVGTACGQNPLLLFIPCHRVVARSGGLGGFRAGTARKEFLLHHEREFGGAVREQALRTEADRPLHN